MAFSRSIAQCFPIRFIAEETVAPLSSLTVNKVAVRTVYSIRKGSIIPIKSRSMLCDRTNHWMRSGSINAYFIASNFFLRVISRTTGVSRDEVTKGTARLNLWENVEFDHCIVDLSSVKTYSRCGSSVFPDSEKNIEQSGITVNRVAGQY